MEAHIPEVWHGPSMFFSVVPMVAVKEMAFLGVSGCVQLWCGIHDHLSECVGVCGGGCRRAGMTIFSDGVLMGRGFPRQGGCECGLSEITRGVCFLHS